MNKYLLNLVFVFLIIAVISFKYKDVETNFNLEKKEKEITVKVLVNNEVKTLNLEDYIIGVVAGEMPASFEMEALKAQSVASRTFALFKKNNSNGNYDLTDDTSSQVYLTKEEMKEKWNNDYNKYYEKIKKAVMSTKNEVMTKDNEIIKAYYFAMSNGNTQDASYVFKEEDYLKKVDSIYDNESINNYKVVTKYTKEDFKSKLNIECEQIIIKDIIKNESNYINSINICNKVFSGIEVRKLLNLRSASFDINVNNDIEITTYGYGHGVGMSQYGANGYAKNGYDYKQILKHYYTNIEITSIN